MNFFRLRFINTLLVLFIGVVLGYIMKEHAGGNKGARPYAAKYTATYAAQSDAGETPFAAANEPHPASEARTGAAAPVRGTDRITGEEDFEMPVELPAAQDSEEPSAAGSEMEVEPLEEKDADVVRGSEDAFFKNPARFFGQILEMDLQMIMARRTARGWLLNLVRSKGGTNVDYLYLEDASVVGDKPDLKIGYSYKVRFRCQKGDAASGNKLLRLTATNEKASWATGVSAVE